MRFPKLFGRRETRPETAGEEGVNCAHLVLVPTWSSPADMGKEEKASGYRCYACGTHLTLEQATAVRGRNAISL